MSDIYQSLAIGVDAAVLEYDGAVAYLYHCRTDGPEGLLIKSALRIDEIDASTTEDDIEVLHESTRSCFVLRVRGKEVASIDI